MKSSSIPGILSRMVFLPVFILAVFAPRSLSEGEAFVYRSTAMPATIQPLYLPLLVNIIGLPATAAPTATPTATSAPSWTERTAPLSPSPRDNMEMVYDSSRDVVMLFGGDDGTQLLSDTWEWDGTTWTEKTPATQPTSRYFFSMAYDSQRQVTVLFGGKRGDGTALSDTWEWDGTNWTKKTPMTSPSSRWGHAMAYDRVRGKVVLFGGVCNYGGSGSACNDTWEWDGTNWMKKTPASSPSSRWGHAMAYDSSRGVLVLFGGQTADRTLGDTWAWDGTNWTLKTPEFSPPPRANHTLALDRLNNVIVLFGGFTPQAGPFGDTWAWNGFVWEEISSSISPNARYGHAMTFDSQRAEIVLFGGYDGTDRLNDTWVFPR